MRKRKIVRKVKKKRLKEIVLEAKNVFKVYNEGYHNEVTVLKNVNLQIRQGEFIAVMGPSGSGKTTLLDVMGCLMKPTKGEVYVDGKSTGEMEENELSKIRGEKIGFIFQQYNLIPSLSALENVEFPIRILGRAKGEAKQRAESLLKLVGLGERMKNRPSQLSGGEQQRVAIARSLANAPKIILGDEPTGNLDTKTGNAVLEILKKLNKQEGYTVIIVTHDPRITKIVDYVIRIRDGVIA